MKSNNRLLNKSQITEYRLILGYFPLFNLHKSECQNLYKITAGGIEKVKIVWYNYFGKAIQRQ